MKRTHPGRPALLLAASLLAAIPGEALAQAIESVTVKKGHAYTQTGPGTVAIDTASNNFGFGADVDGTNIAGIAPPRVQGPFNPSLGAANINNGFLRYSEGDRGWRWGSTANDFGTATLANLNASMPNGTYTFTVNGASIPLQLTGDAYPNAPVMTFAGGTWRDGKYVIDPAQALTVTTNQFTAYGTNADDLICVGILGGALAFPFENVAPFGCEWSPTLVRQYASQLPGSKTISFTLPANTLVSGQEYTAIAIFHAIVDGHTDAALPGSRNVAYYEVATFATVKAESGIFPLTVTGSIGPVTSNITANIGYRPQDVGTTQSVYVFAVAPQDKVIPAPLSDPMPPLAKAMPADGSKADAPVACVLSQLTASGQLQQVSASSMQAFVTGVLGAQGASIAVLNNTSTVNIAGATFYIGYGPTAQAMLTGGINRNVVPVPGTKECRPGPPKTGWWWYPAEDGRGYSLEAAGRNFFYAAFLYDEAGRSKWYVATGPMSVDGSLFTGNLLEVLSGQTLFGDYRAPAAPRSVGPITLAFANDSIGTQVWPGGTIPIERFNIVPNGLTTPPKGDEPESGWWWNPNESGRGFFLEFQNGSVDIAGYMYDDAGNAVWYLTVLQTPNPRQWAGSWWTFGGGQTLTGAFKPNAQTSNNFAPLAITFDSTTTATLSLPGGRTTRLVRHRF